MNRFDDLIKHIKKEYIDDWWLNCYPMMLDEDSFSAQFAIYEKALQSMDIDTFVALKAKIIILFKQNDPRRGKNQFFNQLNEALAYEHLQYLGCTHIEFLLDKAKNKIETPDLSFKLNGKQGLCEVKTISVSDDELGRHTAGKIFSSDVYKNLGYGFFTKLSEDINTAINQMCALDCMKLIYIIVHFDDNMLLYYSTYKKQIIEHIKKHHSHIGVYFRVGLYGKEYIHCLPEKD